MTHYFVGPNNSWSTTDSDDVDQPTGFTEVSLEEWETAKEVQAAASAQDAIDARIAGAAAHAASIAALKAEIIAEIQGSH